MRMETIKLIAQSDYVGFTLERLDNRFDRLSDVINDPNALDDEIAQASTERKKVRACISLFIQEDIDDPSATPADILEIITGTSLFKLQKQTAGGVLAEDLWDKTVGATKATSNVTKKGLHGFANWLANKTGGAK
jgi:hypothetical protein